MPYTPKTLPKTGASTYTNHTYDLLKHFTNFNHNTKQSTQWDSCVYADKKNKKNKTKTSDTAGINWMIPHKLTPQRYTLE